MITWVEKLKAAKGKAALYIKTDQIQLVENTATQFPNAKNPSEFMISLCESINFKPTETPIITNTEEFEKLVFERDSLKERLNVQSSEFESKFTELESLQTQKLESKHKEFEALQTILQDYKKANAEYDTELSNLLKQKLELQTRIEEANQWLKNNRDRVRSFVNHIPSEF